MPESRRQTVQKRIVGALIVATLGGIALLMYHLREQTTPFSALFSVHAVVDRADAIRIGTPVTLAGISVGDVVALEITDDSRIEIEMELDARYHDNVRRNSQATLINPTFGNPHIDISIGSANRQAIGDGGRIELHQATSLADIVAELPARLEQLDRVVANHIVLSNGLIDPKGDLQRALSQVNAGLENFVTLSTNLLRTESQLHDNLARFEDVAARSDTAVAQFVETQVQLNRILASAAGALEQLETGTDDLPRRAEDVAVILRDIRAVAAELRGVAPRLGELVRSSEDVVREADRTLRASQKNVLIAPHIPTPASGLVRGGLRDPALADPGRATAQQP